MTINEIKELIGKEEFAHYGIRCEEDTMRQVGEELDNSRIWIDNEPTEETLNGTSCIGIESAEDVGKAMELIKNYYGNCLYIIAGDYREYGEDEGEHIIQNATVVARIY